MQNGEAWERTDIDTRYLWLQERIALKHLKLFSVPTTDNPADLFTKCLPKATMEKFVKALNQVGKAETYSLEELDTFYLELFPEDAAKYCETNFSLRQFAD